jgi:hypothetical protein
VVDVVITHRRLAAIMQFDPIVGRLVHGNLAHPAFERIRRIFAGSDPDPATNVRVAMVSGGLMMAGVDPALSGLDDDQLRHHLLTVAHRVLGRPARRAAHD